MCLKPSTYMNRMERPLTIDVESGNIPQENVLIITDDINLFFGTHPFLKEQKVSEWEAINGLKDIQEVTCSLTIYHRLRFCGVVRILGKGGQQID